MPDDLKAALLSPYVSIENDEVRLTARIRDSLPDLRRNALLEDIQSGLETEVGLAPERFQVSGLVVLYNNMLQSLFSSQILSLGVVMLGIALMLLILFRSLRLAVIGIAPNLPRGSYHSWNDGLGSDSTRYDDHYHRVDHAWYCRRQQYSLHLSLSKRDRPHRRLCEDVALLSRQYWTRYLLYRHYYHRRIFHTDTV